MKGGEAQVNNASVTGLKDAAVADTNLQWEAVDFEDLNAVYGFATRLARDLDRLDVVSSLACRHSRFPSLLYT